MFPGRLASQVAELEDKENEWAIASFVTHRGTGPDTIFEALWKSGDKTWVPYSAVQHLEAMKDYLDASGVSNIEHLPQGNADATETDVPLYLGGIHLKISRRRHTRRKYKKDPTPTQPTQHQVTSNPVLSHQKPNHSTAAGSGEKQVFNR